MAIGWLTVLQSVPWGEVVNNAPKVAAGAKKLWGVVGRKTPPDARGAAEPQVSRPPEAQGAVALQLRLEELEAALADMQGQMVASSELIKELAEQNTQLILRIETLRRRLIWLAVLSAVATLAAAGSLALGLKVFSVL